MTIPIKIIDKDKFEEKPNQEKVWDEIARTWEIYVVKEVPIVKEFLENKKGLVLDLGCGNGRNMIANKNIQYYGVDFSEEQLKRAKEVIKKRKIKAKLFKSSADKLDKEIFKNEIFDYGLFMATLHCLESEEKRKKAISEFYRVLKPGAEALISVWLKDDFRFKGHKKDIYMSWRQEGIPIMRYYHLYSKQELIKLLKGVGFEILEIYSPREHDRFSKKNLVLRVRK
ncbi:MAG: class I SAM-dependent methyltransferase [Candidatus Pacearchaeota archaeon]